MIWNWLRRHPLLVDVGLVAVLLAVTIIVATHNSHTTASIVLGTIETVPLLWRRRRPLAVVVVVTAATLAIVAIDLRLLPFQLAVALYTLAALSGTRTARLTGVASIAAITIALAATGYSQFGDSAARVVFLVAAWLLGDSVGSRRAYVREIEEKARRLEREREAETQRVVAEEQSRIARELHDVVAHALSVIVVQAAAADDVFEVEPRRAREPIRAIELAARAALGDLRRVLGDHPGRRGVRAAAGAGAARQPRRAGARDRSRGRARVRGCGAAAAGGGRSFRLSDRAGGADEHAQARGRGARDRARPLRRRARRWRSGTTAPAAATRTAAAASSACASASPCSAAASTPARARAAAISSRPRSRSTDPCRSASSSPTTRLSSAAASG